MSLESSGVLSSADDRRFMLFNAVVSTLALAFLAWLLLLRNGVSGGADLSFMPAVNACFNALSACLLVSGVIAIKNGKIAIHKRLMVSAFASSSLFLIGYVVYHYVHGDTKYQGTGAMRALYFAVLISHVLLSMAVVPMALASFYYAFRERFITHARVARILFPIWLYVSVTGVVIFFMLRGSGS
jgi:putative membrane protein